MMEIEEYKAHKVLLFGNLKRVMGKMNEKEIFA